MYLCTMLATVSVTLILDYISDPIAMMVMQMMVIQWSLTPRFILIHDRFDFRRPSSPTTGDRLSAKDRSITL